RLPRRRAGAGPGVGRNLSPAGVVSVISSHPPLPGRDAAGQRRIVVMAAVVLSAFLVVIGQLWYLQVLEGGRFLDASDKNRIRVRPIAAPRGILFDRNGVPLVDNRPAFTLSIIPRELDDRDAGLGRLPTLLGLPYQELVGATGLERRRDEFLRGRDGGERIEVDAMGRAIRIVQQTEPHPGAQVVTTIDRRIQEVAEKAMEGKAGAVVVMDPRNGDVLAL